MPDESFSAAVGRRVIFENERVRVWEMPLQPGEQCEFHQHHHDHLIIYPDGGTMRGQELGDPEWGIVNEAEPGFVLYRTVGSAAALNPHRLKNLSDVTVNHYIVELLEKSPSVSSEPMDYNERGKFHNSVENTAAAQSPDRTET